MKIETIHPDQLTPNNWNPNKQSDFIYEREKRSIREFGFVDPITVREVEGTETTRGRREIVDGEHRYRAALELGLQEVTVFNLGEVSQDRAMALTDIMNNIRGNNDARLQAEMLRNIVDDAPELRELLPYTEDQLKQYTSGVDWEGLDNKDTESRPKKHGIQGRWDPDDYQSVKRALDLAAGYLPKKSTVADQVLFICQHYLSQLKQPQQADDVLKGL